MPARVADDAIRVTGLKEFLSKMQTLQVEAPRKVSRVALNSVAELVVQDAQRRAPARTGKLRASIRASSTATLVRVSEGSSKVPYAGFIDYGGTVGRLRTGNFAAVRGTEAATIHARARAARTARFFAVRPFIRTGRILYPAYRAQKAGIPVAMNKALRDAAKSVGIEVES